jgi:hypothetical protein
VLEAKCLRCHSEPPENGAPFSLVTYSDTREPRPSGELVHETMLRVVSTNIMPPTSGSFEPPAQPLTCRERTTLLDWLEAGGPRPADNDPSCAGFEPTLLDCED